MYMVVQYLLRFSKAFDTINHDLLVAKLGAYSSDTETLKLIIKSYLTNHFQRTKVNPVSVVGQNCF